MHVDFKAPHEFITTLEEVELLLEYASKNERNELCYKTFNKSAILLLMSKVESFLENILDEYLTKINELNLEIKEIPLLLKLSHSFQKIDELTNKKQKNNHQEIASILADISRLWGSQETKFNELSIDFNFTFGKHGETEIKKLFSLIGIDDIFDVVKIHETTEEGEMKRIDIKGKINSLTHIRNNIIHEDATPSLTHVDIIDFVKSFKIFANQVATLLDKLFPTIIIINYDVI